MVTFETVHECCSVKAVSAMYTDQRQDHHGNWVYCVPVLVPLRAMLITSGVDATGVWGFLSCLHTGDTHMLGTAEPRVNF